jgi:3-hydroxybutyryl-CoA dehydrogenase
MGTAIETVAVCGAGGTMGAGIAIVAARAGFRTICHDLAMEGLDRAARQTEAFFAKSVERGRMTAADKDAVMGRLSRTTSLDDLVRADLVIEAVYEDLAVKRQLFSGLDVICPTHTIFASNTSTLSISEIAAGSRRADRVVGLHFCLPAQLMQLVEVSPGLNTSEETLSAAWAWCEKAGQLPVKTQDKPGFILNALLIPYLNDAIRAVEAGVASAADIDTAIKVGLGHKMGPLELIDLVGLDTMLRLCEAFYPVTLDPRASAPPLVRRMVAAGQLGRKTGRGFYTYSGHAMFGA